MSTFLRYAAVATGLIVLVTAGVSGLLDAAGRRSLWVAAMIALPVQFAAFGLLVWTRDRGRAFMIAFLVGGAIRLLTFGVAGWTGTKLETGLAAAPLILGLAGYFFALLLLEVFFLRGAAGTE